MTAKQLLDHLQSYKDDDLKNEILIDVEINGQREIMRIFRVSSANEFVPEDDFNGATLIFAEYQEKGITNEE